jgi:chromate transport protein ChrA
MFLPAFILPIVLHHQLDALVGQRGVIMDVLDGMAATTVGLISVTALQLLRSSVKAPVDAIIFVASLQTLYAIKHQFTPVLIIFCAAMAGQVLFY